MTLGRKLEVTIEAGMSMTTIAISLANRVAGGLWHVLRPERVSRSGKIRESLHFFIIHLRDFMHFKSMHGRLPTFSLILASLALTGCLASSPTKTEEAAPTAPTNNQGGKAKAAATAPAEAGDKKEVKGTNGWTGTISGKPAKNSKFNRLKIGMSPKQVTDLIGQPNDQSAHITGKAFIPFYYGSGGNEVVYYYKGLGRLYFANNTALSTDRGLNLIEHDAAEDGYP